jgi:hypothetical protein
MAHAVFSPSALLRFKLRVYPVPSGRTQPVRHSGGSYRIKPLNGGITTEIKGNEEKMVILRCLRLLGVQNPLSQPQALMPKSGKRR